MKTYHIFLWITFCALSYPALSQDTLYVDAASTHSAKTDAEVGQHWGKAYKYLDSALHYANTSDYIWVKQGTYIPGGANPTADSRFNLNTAGLQIYGGFAGHETNVNHRTTGAKSILSGDIGTKMTDPADIAASNAAFTDNVIQIVRITAGDIRLDGFIVEHAAGITPENLKQHPSNHPTSSPNLYQTDNNAHLNNGGGIYNNQSTTLLSNLEVRYNHAYTGAGIYMLGGTIQNCDIHSNRTEPWYTISNAKGYQGGGAVYLGGGDVTTYLINAKIHHNEHGYEGSGILMRGKLLTGNQMQAVFIQGCAVYNNTEKSTRGSPHKAKDGTPITTPLAGKSTSAGGVIDGLFRIRNSTFYNNRVWLTSYGGIGDSGFRTHNYITNSIFYSDLGDNNPAQIYRRVMRHSLSLRSKNIVFLNNVVKGGFTTQTIPKEGTEKTTGDPNTLLLAPKLLKADKATEIGNADIVGGTATASELFASTSHAYATRDSILYLHLKSGSAAVDAGSNTQVPSGLTEDVDGLQRKIGTVDIGAYEYVGSSVPTPLAWAEGGVVKKSAPAGAYIGHLTSNLPGTPMDTFYLSDDTDSGGFVIKGDRVYAGTSGAPATAKSYAITVANGFLGDWVTTNLNVTVADEVSATAIAISDTPVNMALNHDQARGLTLGNLSATTTPTGAYVSFSVAPSDTFGLRNGTQLFLAKTLNETPGRRLHARVTATPPGGTPFTQTFTYTVTARILYLHASNHSNNHVVANRIGHGEPRGTTVAFIRGAASPSTSITYSLGGTDADSFRIQGNQLKVNTDKVSKDVNDTYNFTIVGEIAHGGTKTTNVTMTVLPFLRDVNNKLLSITNNFVPANLGVLRDGATWAGPPHSWKVGDVKPHISPPDTRVTLRIDAKWQQGNCYKNYTLSFGTLTRNANSIPTSKALRPTCTGVSGSTTAEGNAGITITLKPEHLSRHGESTVVYASSSSDGAHLIGVNLVSYPVNVTSATLTHGNKKKKYTHNHTGKIATIGGVFGKLPDNLGGSSTPVAPAHTPLEYAITSTNSDKFEVNRKGSFGLKNEVYIKSGADLALGQHTLTAQARFFLRWIPENDQLAPYRDRKATKDFTITLTADITDINLNPSSILKTSPANTKVGDLTAVFTPSGTAMTYSVQETNNFEITNENDLVLKPAPTEGASYTATVKVVGGDTSYVKVFTINAVSVVIESIALSSTSVNATAAVNTEIGTLSATTTPSGETVTFSIPTSAPSDIFKVDGTSLKLKRAILSTDASPQAVTVRATSGSVSQEQTFQITINRATISALTLDNKTVPPNSAADYVVGTLSATVTPPTTSLTFSVPDNEQIFKVDGTSLKLNRALTNADTGPFNVSVTVTGGGATRQETFRITTSTIRISALKLSFNQVPVGAAANYEIGTLSATVTPAGTKVTYSVTRTTRFLIGGESNDKLLLKDSPTKEETLQATVKAEAGGVVRTNPFVIKILDASKFLSTSAFPSLYVYPNPTTGLIRVSGLQLDDQVVLYTLDGQRVNRTIHRKTPALDISDWPDGTYLIRVLSKEALRPKFSGLVVKKTQ